MQNTMSLNDFEIAFLNGTWYRIHFWYMSKDEAITFLKNVYLLESVTSNNTDIFYNV